jgi:hypothetical protein
MLLTQVRVTATWVRSAATTPQQDGPLATAQLFGNAACTRETTTAVVPGGGGRPRRVSLARDMGGGRVPASPANVRRRGTPAGRVVAGGLVASSAGGERR